MTRLEIGAVIDEKVAWAFCWVPQVQSTKSGTKLEWLDLRCSRMSKEGRKEGPRKIWQRRSPRVSFTTSEFSLIPGSITRVTISKRFRGRHGRTRDSGAKLRDASISTHATSARAEAGAGGERSVIFPGTEGAHDPRMDFPLRRPPPPPRPFRDVR